MPRHQPARGGADDTEAHRARYHVVQRGHVGDQRIQLSFDAPGPVGDRLTFFGEPAGAAVDQHGVELAFEAGNVGRHVRLHGVQRRGRGGETAFVGHGDESGELAEIHRSKR